MKANDLREKTTEELNIEVNQLVSELFKLRFQHATNQLDNPMKIKEVKKDIARVKTILRENDIAANVAK